MPAARYWRIVGIQQITAGNLSLSELSLGVNGVRSDSAATITSSFAPISGSLSALNDGGTASSVVWAEADVNAPRFAIEWDLGADYDINEVEVLGKVFRYAILQCKDASGNWQFVYNLASYLSNGVPTLSGNIDARCPLVFGSFSGGYAAGWQNRVPMSIMQSKHRHYVRGIQTIALAHQGGSAASTAIAPTVTYAIDTTRSFKFFGSNANWYPDFAIIAVEFLDSSDTVVAAFKTFQNLYGINVKYGPNLSNLTTTAGSATTFPQPGGTFSFNSTQLVFVTDNSYDISNFTFNCAASTIKKIRVSELFTQSTWTGGNVGGAHIYFYDASISLPQMPIDITNNLLLNGAAETTQPIPTVSVVSENSKSYAPTTSQVDTASINSGVLPMKSRAQFGGFGTIKGSVKEIIGGGNQPLARRVQLLDERSGVVVDETWSDAATGLYTFTGLSKDPYSVVAYDHGGYYRAVIANNLIPS